MFAGIALVLGLTLGLVSGGSFGALSRTRFRHEWLLLMAFLAQGVVRGRLPGTVAVAQGVAVWAGISIVLVAILGINAAKPGALVAAAGVMLNLDVVLLNHGMPVLTAVTAPALAAIARSSGFYHFATAGTQVAWAGDTLVVSFATQSQLLSVGDVLLVVGVVVLIAAQMLTAKSIDEGSRRSKEIASLMGEEMV